MTDRLTLLGWASHLRLLAMLLVGMSVVWPVKFQVGSISIISLCALSIIGWGLAGFKRVGWQPVLLFAIGWVLLTASEFPRALDGHLAWKELERKLSWVALPVSVWVWPFPQKQIREMGYYFTLSVVLLGLASLACACVSYYRTGLGFHFVGTSLVWYWRLHRVYCSIQALIALLLCLKCPSIFKPDGLRVFFILFLFLFIILLGSKLAYGLLGAFMVIEVGRNFKKRRFAWIAVIAALGLAGAVFVYKVEYLRNIAITALPLSYKQTKKQANDGSISRVAIWSSAVHALKKENNWIFGVGPGNTLPQLRTAFLDNNLSTAAKDKYNAHNQFLQVWLETGLPGLFLMIGLFVAGFAQFRRQTFALLLWAMFFIALQTECFLEAYHGTVLFSLMTCILVSVYAKKNSELHVESTITYV